MGRALLVLFCTSVVCPALTPDQWRQDLQALATRLPALDQYFFVHASRSDFDAAVAVLDADLSNLSDGQIVSRMAQLVAMGGDGHTNLSLLQSAAKFHVFPLALSWFQEGIYVTGAASSPAALPALGKRLIRINDTAVDDAVALVSTAISHDTDQWVKFQAPAYLAIPELLATVGIIPDPSQARYTFDNGDGTELPVDLAAFPTGSSVAYKAPRSAFPNQPLYQRNSLFYYWARYLDDSSTLYIKYNSCAQDPSFPFAVFVAQVLAVVDNKPVSRIIYDLRNNEGGDTSVIQPLLAGLQDRQRRGILPAGLSTVTIIGRETFSSGVLNAYDMWVKGATLVGEAAGWNPNGFGQVGSLYLPNSGLRVSYSTRKFTLGGVGSLLVPDVAVDWRWADYVQEGDAFLAAALTVQPR